MKAPAPALRPETLSLIEAGHRFSSFYRGGLSNHLPMSLVALERLGARQEQLQAFAAAYAGQLEALPPPLGVITEETADGFLGRVETEGSWVEFFAGRLAAAGTQAVLRTWIKRLLPGIGSVAFHAILRLAYALEAGSGREIAHALAQWAADYSTLGELPAFEGPSRSPGEVLAGLAGDPRFFTGRYRGKRITVRMEQVKADPEFPPLVAAVGASGLDAPGLARAFLEAYLGTGNFTVLHAVTGLQAFELLTPFMEDPVLARRRLWQALVCAYLSAGGPSLGCKLKGDPGLGWEEIRRRAAASQDEHDIKLAYTCWSRWRDCGDDLYRRAASATLG